MTHGDDSGLVLPPAIAPIQLIVVPIAAHKEGVTEKATEVTERLKKICRAKIDVSDNSPGWKFAEYEMKGVPLRLELGPRDIENNQCVLVRRDNGEKVVVSLDELETVVPRMLEAVRDGLYNRALANRTEKTYTATTMEEMIDIADNKPGFIKAMWCEDRACEETLKEKAGVSSRCMPFEQEQLSDKCVCCGKPAKKMVYWGKAY
jgi:prolyl-tRNA synthetase